MLYRVMDKSQLPALVRGFMESYEVVAPVQRGERFVFDRVEDPDQIALGYSQTDASPKKYLFPPVEALMRFDAKSNLVEDFVQEVKPRVIFGVHACDISGFNRLDLALSRGKYVDPYYKARREATLVVGISCMPIETCFCQLMGADEVQFGYDLFLYDLGEKYLVSMSSVTATNILEAHCELSEATDEDRKVFRHKSGLRQKAYNPDIPAVEDVPMLMDVFHSDPFWDELGERCLSCSACASVCPTCYCFDIHDVLEENSNEGVRERTWDACTSPNFALVAGNHNFRPTARDRVRHRMYHKLNGFMVNHDRMLCTGCGRCVKACKASIDPIQVLKFFERKGAEDA